MPRRRKAPNHWTHPDLSEAPQSFPKTSFSIFLRNLWLWLPWFLSLAAEVTVAHPNWWKTLRSVWEVFSSVCICASFHWLTARLNLMLVQPMLSLVTRRDSPPPLLPPGSCCTPPLPPLTEWWKIWIPAGECTSSNAFDVAAGTAQKSVNCFGGGGTVSC